MRLLVTGGAGFMGSNFVRYMLDSHDETEIVNLDAMKKEANPKNIDDIKNRFYRFIKGDITKTSDLEKAGDIDAIVNYAAETHVDRSIADAQPFLESNLLGVLHLLQLVRRTDARFIQIGTDEVYGSVAQGSSTENSPLNPRNPYSASKAAADLLIKSFVETYGVKAVLTRSCNNFGPRQHSEKLIPKTIINLLTGRKVPIYGTGRNVREWIFVRDHCSAVKFLMSKGKPGEVYNIGTGNEKKNIDLVKSIVRLLGKTDASMEFVEDRPGHDFRYSLDWSKLKKLGWKPEHSFEAALKETVDWYIKNPQWWKPLI